MQQSPCFNSFSPEETSKLFFQRFNNGFCSPHTIFYGFGLSSSGQHSLTKNNILYKMKFSSSNKKQIFNNSNKPNFLSNKRHLLSESSEKINTKKNSSNNKNINKTNQALNTINRNEETFIESQNDVKKTKASSKKYSTYMPPQLAECPNNYNNGYYNTYNYGLISNSSLARFNKTSYIGSVKKNLLPSLSKELKSNTKNKVQNQNNNNNNISSTDNNKNNNIKKYNNSDSQKKSKNSCFKSNINSSSKKTTNDSTPYDYLYKITESLDLEKMVDYIVSSTKIYNRYNDNKENYSNNQNNNNLINQNESNEKEKYNNYSYDYNYYSENKNNKKIKKNNNDNFSYSKNLNNQIDNQNNQKAVYSICKCKKVECLKYSCSCLKSGNRCNNLCSCMNCKNKDSNLFKIDE